MIITIKYTEKKGLDVSVKGKEKITHELLNHIERGVVLMLGNLNDQFYQQTLEETFDMKEIPIEAP